QDVGEACDSSGVNTANCDSDCTAPTCGDGIFNSAAEPCDDGNTNNGDACENDCTLPVCGNGIQDVGEACDSSGVNTASCDSDCTAPQCGDGIFNSSAEPCDD